MDGRAGSFASGRRPRLVRTALLAAGFVAGVRSFPWLDGLAATAAGTLALPYASLATLERWVAGPGIASDPERFRRAQSFSDALDARERQQALAGRSGVLDHGGLVASVVKRDEADATFEIDRGSVHGVASGDPVTFGDVFAGVVATVRDDRSVVQFPWHRAVRLCLQTVGEPQNRLVARGAGSGLLSVLVSKDRRFPPAATVELAATPDGSPLDLAAGFRVGTLLARASGLFAMIEVDPVVQDERMVQVVVQTSNSDRGAPSAVEPPRWQPLTLAFAGDAVPGRSSALGFSKGALALGAPVAFDGHFVGAVARTGGPTVRVRFLEDPGFTLRVVLLTDTGSPIPLRRVRTVGASGRRIVFEPVDRWPESPVPSQGILLTAGGDGAIPKGLVVGVASIEDAARGRPRIVVTRSFQGTELEDVVVLASMGS